MATKYCCEYVLKVPIEIRKKLAKLLKHSKPGLKFSELSIEFEKKYQRKLEIFFANDNEFILEVNDGFKHYIGDAKGDLKFTDDGPEFEYSLADLKELLNKVDFTDEFSKKSEKAPFYSSSSSSRSYVEITVQCFVSKSSDNDIADVRVKKTSETLLTNRLTNFFDKWSWRINDIFQVFVTNIYDPSKFWIRFVSVDSFQKQLWEFYKQKGKPWSLTLSEVRIGLDCVALISNSYYRVQVVGAFIYSRKYFKVFLYDFGMVLKVQISQLHHWDEHLNEIPAFAVRAALANISSLDNQLWDLKAVDRFMELTDVKPLIAQIAYIHVKRKVLEIELLDGSIEKRGKIPTINYRLVCEGFAKIAWHPPAETKENVQFKFIRDFLYQYPSFEMIENGLVTWRAHWTEQLKDCIPWDMIFPKLYQFQCQE